MAGYTSFAGTAPRSLCCRGDIARS